MGKEDRADPNLDVIELGRALLPVIAPRELPVYDELVAVYRSPEPRPSSSTDHPLAFGVGDIVEAASPILYDTAKLVVAFLVAEMTEQLSTLTKDAAKAARLEASEKITAWIKNKLRQPPLHLSDRQRAQLVANMRSQLKKNKASPILTEKIVKAVEQSLNSKKK